MYQSLFSWNDSTGFDNQSSLCVNDFSTMLYRWNAIQSNIGGARWCIFACRASLQLSPVSRRRVTCSAAPWSLWQLGITTSSANVEMLSLHGIRFLRQLVTSEISPSTRKVSLRRQKNRLLFEIVSQPDEAGALGRAAFTTRRLLIISITSRLGTQLYSSMD